MSEEEEEEELSSKGNPRNYQAHEYKVQGSSEFLHRPALVNMQKLESSVYARVYSDRRARSKETRHPITARLYSLSPYQRLSLTFILSPTVSELLFKFPRRFARRQHDNNETQRSPHLIKSNARHQSTADIWMPVINDTTDQEAIQQPR